MPQTLGAFLAMLVVMMFAMNFQQSSLQTQRRVLGSEVDVMANALASEAMQYVAAKPFDASVSTGVVNTTNPDLSSLTLDAAFGGGLAYADAADVDDFDGVIHTVSYESSFGSDLDFDISFLVSYVDDYGNASVAPTWTKEVTVQVDGPSIMITPVRLTRQFAPLWY